MLNVLLDDMPEEWEGIPINSDYRIGIQICLAYDDDELTDYEKLVAIQGLLFPCGFSGTQEEMGKCIDWFLNGWNHDKTSSSKSNVRQMDFDVDQWRIYSAFRIQYRIDLSKVEMHWWEFMGLLSCVDECEYTRIIEIRNKKVNSKMSREQRGAILKAKHIYSLEKEKPLSEEESEAVEQFNKLLNSKE